MAVNVPWSDARKLSAVKQVGQRKRQSDGDTGELGGLGEARARGAKPRGMAVLRSVRRTSGAWALRGGLPATAALSSYFARLRGFVGRARREGLPGRGPGVVGNAPITISRPER